ncbi:uncharacterized protein ACNLHF_026339 isoform 2-T2 [Anomaloglossus baeobatrachus]|uniref:uncharacterized protein LOC142257889 isoform X2 n=1 Tax=Anomaloglossus baeobatrachus TaxID=238106 RepID=UPI003F50C1AF
MAVTSPQVLQLLHCSTSSLFVPRSYSLLSASSSRFPEEWEDLEGHKERYEEVMMGEQRPITAQDGLMERIPPERCPRPLCPQDCPEEKHNVPETPQMSGPQNEAFIREFIEKYRTLPCLWRMKSAEYSNKLLKKEAYVQLVAVYNKHFPYEPADESVVRKKIQALRTVFKKELNKVEDSQRSGSGTAEVYVPRLWYYDLLLFTRDQDIPRPSTSMMPLQDEDLDDDPPESLVKDVPIRCQDDSVFLSTEECEYLEGHKEVMMEEQRPVTAQDGLMERNPPERCPRPLCPQDCPEEKHNVPETHQGEDLIDIKVEVKDEAEETMDFSMNSQDGLMERNPPERCPQDCPEEKHNVPETPQMSGPQNEAFIRELIEKYRTLPCLWRVRSAEYSNKQLKKEAYVQLVAVYNKHFPYEPADESESAVKKKIQALRTVFKKELNKVEDSKKSGSGTAEVYVPRLWYYDLLLFTRDHDIPRPSTSMMPLQEEDLDDNPPESMVKDEASLESITQAGPSATPSLTPETGEVVHEAAGPSSMPTRLLARRRRITTAASRSSELVGLCHSILEKHNRPAISGFSHFLDDELRQMNDSQREHAQRVIIDVLRAGKAGFLTATSSFAVGEQAGPSSGSQQDTTHVSPQIPTSLPVPYSLRRGRSSRNKKRKLESQEVNGESPESDEWTI